MNLMSGMTEEEIEEMHDFNPDGLSDSEVYNMLARNADVIRARKLCTVWNCANRADAAHFSTALELPYCSNECRELAEAVERSIA